MDPSSEIFPKGLPIKLYNVFLLISLVSEGNVAFLVHHNDQIQWLFLHEMIVSMLMRLQSFLPQNRDQIDWQRLCQNFLEQYPKLLFMVGIGEVSEIEWEHVIFIRQTMLVQLEDGREVLAKYIETVGDRILCEVRGTGEEVIIPISAIKNHNQSRSSVEEFDKAFAQRKAAAEKAEEVRQQSEAFKILNKEKGKIISGTYPILTKLTLQFIYHLCIRCNVKLGFTEAFNRLLSDFLDPKGEIKMLKFSDEICLVEMSSEEQANFKEFETEYTSNFAGTIIHCFDKNEYPDFSDHLIRILYHLCKRCNIKIGFKHRFNLLVDRLLSFGDQTPTQLPPLPEEKKAEFEAFKTMYTDEMVGKIKCSRKGRHQEQRSLEISGKFKRMLEYHLSIYGSDDIDEDINGFLTFYKDKFRYDTMIVRMKTHVQALSLPDSYWLQPEQGVEVRKLKSRFPMPYHHLIRDRKVFDELVRK
jgi:hypothetical protein